MNSRERLRTIIAGKAADRCGFWMGNPHNDTWPIYYRYFGTTDQNQIRRQLGDDFVWISPQFFEDVPCHPDGRKIFDTSVESFGKAAPLEHCTEVSQLDDYPWPDARYLNFDSCLEALRSAGDLYRASGFWTCFYHNVMDLIGMENYMMSMYTNPRLVHAITDRVCQFYYDANEAFFQAAGDLVDAFFFGNDFGTQLDLICGPKQFDEFILPWFRRFTEQGHRHGHQVVLHSCGAIHKVIDRLIDAGVDCLHPLQAKAANMDAETLARDYKGKIAFLGGIDTQELLVHGKPEEIQQEVRRIKKLLGPCLIVSPSHEALLPNVPPENVVAMAEATRE